MLFYFILAMTFLIVIAIFFCIMDWRWEKRMKDLEKIFKRLDLPQIEIDDIHTRVPFE